MIRDISDFKIKKENISFEYIRDNIGYMLLENNKINIDIAREPMHRSFAMFISKDPRKQGIDEKRQINLLKNKMVNFHAAKKYSIFLENGYLTYKPSLQIPIDADGYILENGEIKALISLKEQHNNGGAQNKQFDDLVRFIEHSPNKNSKFNTGIMVSGDYWAKPIKKSFKNFKDAKGKSKIDLLKELAKNKNCSIFTDSDILNVKRTSLWLI